MPNHVTNIIEVQNPDVLARLQSKASKVDFDLLIPFPVELQNITSEHVVVVSNEEADAINKEKNSEVYAAQVGWTSETRHAISFEDQVELVLNFGPALDWYSWNISHWGTKWNAYSIREELNYSTTSGVGIQFDTAWSHPFPVIEELSKHFPDEIITVHFADEDTGSNYGSYVIVNGEKGELPIELEENDFCSQVAYGMSYAELRAEWGDDEEIEE